MTGNMKGFRSLLPALLSGMIYQVCAVELHVDGFGTASLSCFSSETADYVLNDQPEGPGRTRDCDTGIDSLLGVQFDLGLRDSLEFGLQLIADRNEDRGFNPDVSVAQLRWRPTAATTLRLGRMPNPAFIHSEDRQVRYALPWVRPPVEVYSLIPPFSHDGLEILQEGRIGHWYTEWQGGVSVLDYDSPASNSDETFPVETRQAYLGLTLQDSNHLIKLRYGYARISLERPEMERLFTILQHLGPVGAGLADDLAVDNSPSHMLSLGFQRDMGEWLTIAEFAYRSAEGAIRDQSGAYVTQGRRFGPWMLYGTLARRISRGDDTDPRARSLGPLLQNAIETLLTRTRFDTTSASVGLSRQIDEQSTLKFQADWVQPDKQSWGLYYNHSEDYDYANPDHDWLFTLSLDFVF